jgi:sec-independent protein translocase protein TatC
MRLQSRVNPNNAERVTNMATNPHPTDKDMDLIGHLGELRRAIVISIAALATAAVACFTQFERLLTWLTSPIPEVQFIFTAPGETFMASLALAFAGGLIIALPVIMQQVLWFIAPGLTRRERLMLAPAMFLAYALFVGGVAFAYYALLPVGVRFLIGFAPANIKPMLSVGNYLSFSSTLLLGTGAVFELPLVLGFLTFIGIVSSQKLISAWRLAVIGSFIVAAIVTPSIDIFTQTVLAMALMGLYALSIQLARMVEWLRPAEEPLTVPAAAGAQPLPPGRL